MTRLANFRRYKYRYMWQVGGWFAFLCAAAMQPLIACETRDSTAFSNPCPLADDIEFPLPDGEKIVFRKISVPQSAGNINARAVWLGSDNGNAFERPRNVVISGSFPERKTKKWFYLIGKYEVSVAQYLSFEPGTTMKEKFDSFVERIGPWYFDNANNLTDEYLAQPVSALTRFDIDKFLSQYNLWCLSDRECRKLLPTVTGGASDPDSASGYFRLPSEIEWEYAARGGAETLSTDQFRADLPFPQAEYSAYAYVQDYAQNSALPIGSLSAVNGLHDTLGNVSEIVGDYFKPSLGHGHSGAVTARGGSFTTHISNLRFSRRSELALYREIEGIWEEERQSDTGFRIAIGAPALATPAIISTLETGDSLDSISSAGSESQQEDAPADTDSDTSSSLTVLSIEDLKATTLNLPETTSNATRTALQSATRLVEIRLHQSCVGHIKLAGVFAELLGETNRNIQRLSKIRQGYQEAVDSYSDQPELRARYSKRLESAEKNLESDRLKLNQYGGNYRTQILSLQECGRRYGNAAIDEVEQQQLERSIEGEAGQILLSLIKRHFQALGSSGDSWISEVVNLR